MDNPPPDLQVCSDSLFGGLVDHPPILQTASPPHQRAPGNLLLVFILIRSVHVTVLAAGATVISQVPWEVGAALVPVPQGRGKGGI